MYDIRPHLLHVSTKLRTNRTQLRRYQEGEGPTLYKLLQENHDRLENDFRKTIATITSEAAGEFFLRQRIADWLLQKAYYFGIWDGTGQRFIGQICIKNIDWDVAKAEVAYYIHFLFSGKGIMTEVLSRISDYCREDLRLNKLYLKTTIDNIPSQKLAQKCDFRLEGKVSKEFRKKDGNMVDLVYYGLIL